MTWTKEEYPLVYGSNLGIPWMKKYVDELICRRFYHIEMFAAAFIKQVGSEEAGKYMLVESTNGIETRWYYQLREESDV